MKTPIFSKNIQVLTWISIFCLSTSMFADSPVQWVGAIELPTLELKIEVSVTEGEDGNQTATISIPEQGAHMLPLKNVSWGAEAIHFELEASPGMAVFAGTRLSAELIEGSFTQSGATGTFYLEPAEIDENADKAAASQGPVGEPITLEIEAGSLHGSLALPDGDAPTPVALIIGGSGPTDRDGNTVIPPIKNNALKLLALGLQDGGIASLRYDKRGVGESAIAGANESELRFEHYVDDARRWIELLAANDRFSDVYVIGHSEGSLIGMLASQDSSVTGFISLAGSGEDANTLLHNQITQSMKDQLGQVPEGARAGIQNVIDSSIAILDNLKKGERASDIPQALQAVFRPSVQNYLISWMKYEPADELSKLTMPSLIVQGTFDMQIAIENATMLAAKSPNATVVEIDGMNHILKTVKSMNIMDQMATYGNPTLSLHEGLVDEIVAFIEETK